MTSLTGADPLALHALSGQMKAASEGLAEAERGLSRLLASSPWWGPDAEWFGEEWIRHCVPALRSSASRLAEAAESLVRNADDQERASGGGGVGGAGTPSPQGWVPAANISPYGLPCRVPNDKEGVALTQEDADRILKDYQVSADPENNGKTKKYEPSWLQGFAAWLAGKEFPEIYVLPGEEHLLRRLSPWELKQMSDDHEAAFKEADRLYPASMATPNDPMQEGWRNDNQNDAFRHAYWNALMSKNQPPGFAEQYGTAHERLPSNDPTREAMDLYNNEVGRRIQQANPNANAQDLAELVQKAVDNGEMVVVDSKGRLVPSNSIPMNQAGHPDESLPKPPGMDPSWTRRSPGGR